MLHAALDIKNDARSLSQKPPSLYGVDRAEYERLQGLVLDTMTDAGIYPVQYDDLMWRVFGAVSDKRSFAQRH